MELRTAGEMRSQPPPAEKTTRRAAAFSLLLLLLWSCVVVGFEVPEDIRVEEGRELTWFSWSRKLGGVDELSGMYMFMRLRSCLWMRMCVAWSSRVFVGSLGRAAVNSPMVLVHEGEEATTTPACSVMSGSCVIRTPGCMVSVEVEFSFLNQCYVYVVIV